MKWFLFSSATELVDEMSAYWAFRKDEIHPFVAPARNEEGAVPLFALFVPQTISCPQRFIVVPFGHFLCFHEVFMA